MVRGVKRNASSQVSIAWGISKERRCRMKGYFPLSAVIGVVLATLATGIGLVWKWKKG